MKKILYVFSDNNLASGAFNSGVVLVNRLVQDGYDVLATIPCSGNGEELLKKYKIKYINIKSYSWIGRKSKNIIGKIKNLIKIVRMIYNIMPYFKYKNLIKKENIDLVHINTTYHYVAALAAKKNKVKFIWHLREFLEEDQNAKILLKKWGYSLINSSSKIICISKAIFNKYENIFDKDKLEVIYNGIDIERFYKPKHIIFEGEKAKLLCVGGISESKGQIQLCEAIGMLKQKNSSINIELNLVGNCSDENRKKIENIKRKYNISCINILGRKSNPEDYYSKSDIVFMCSISEAFGRVTVEGMLSGALVIGANTAATAEIIKDKQNGLLYDKYDNANLRDTILYALEHKSQMKEIASEGRKFARENFTAELNEKNVSKLYNNLLNSNYHKI